MGMIRIRRLRRSVDSREEMQAALDREGKARVMSLTVENGTPADEREPLPESCGIEVMNMSQSTTVSLTAIV